MIWTTWRETSCVSKHTRCASSWRSQSDNSSRRQLSHLLGLQHKEEVLVELRMKTSSRAVRRASKDKAPRFMKTKLEATEIRRPRAVGWMNQQSTTGEKAE